jgi:hypothetical protein
MTWRRSPGPGARPDEDAHALAFASAAVFGRPPSAVTMEATWSSVAPLRLERRLEGLAALQRDVALLEQAPRRRAARSSAAS